MRKLLLALVVVTFAAVAVSGCCGKCPFTKKDKQAEHPAQ